MYILNVETNETPEQIPQVEPVTEVVKAREVVTPDIVPTDEALSATSIIFRNTYHYKRLNANTVERRRSPSEAAKYSGESLQKLIENQPRYLILKHGAHSFFKISEPEKLRLQNMTIAEAILKDKESQK